MAHKYVLKHTAEERAELERIAKGARGRQSIAAWKVQTAGSGNQLAEGILGRVAHPEGTRVAIIKARESSLSAGSE